MGHPVTAWQIVTKNPDRLAEFYTKLFSWEIRQGRTGLDQLVFMNRIYLSVPIGTPLGALP